LIHFYKRYLIVGVELRKCGGQSTWREVPGV